VPTYEYECSKCRRTFEIRQRISEPALTIHDGCGGEVRRLLSPAPFILKGEGWYVTDYPSEARKKAKEAEKSGAASPSNGGDKSPDKTPDKSADKSSTTSSSASPAPSPSSSPTASKTD
jgi:putative FmdB family regulatory protein